MLTSVKNYSVITAVLIMVKPFHEIHRPYIKFFALPGLKAWRSHHGFLIITPTERFVNTFLEIFIKAAPYPPFLENKAR